VQLIKTWNITQTILYRRNECIRTNRKWYHYK